MMVFVRVTCGLGIASGSGNVFRWRFRAQGDAAAEVSAIVP
jgi:hypothetical protein